MAKSLAVAPLTYLPNYMTIKSSSNPNFASSQPKNFPIAKKCLQVSQAHLTMSRDPVVVMTSNPGSMRVHEVELSVRDYELDQFGVVNNAIYANYCQHGCHEMLRDFTSTDANMIASSGSSLAMSEVYLKYIAPLKSGDRFKVKTKILRLTKTRVLTEQVIVRVPTMEVILEAKSTAVWLNKNNRPTRIPPLVKMELVGMSNYYNTQLPKSNGL